MGQLRVLFHPQATGAYTPDLKLRKINGLPHHSGRHFSNAYDYKEYLTNNHGNLVHYESVCKFLDIDSNRSCRANLTQVFKQFGTDLEKFNEYLSKNFDHIVLSSINFITSTRGDNEAFGHMAKILENLEVPFSIFGIGIQEPPTAEELSNMPNMSKYLQVLNDASQVMSCRGPTTAQWCHDNGYTNAVASGCPSMYVFPDAPERCLENAKGLLDDPKRWYFASAGKIHRKYRRSGLLRCFEPGDKIDYFFQDELHVLVGDGFEDRRDIFSPSTGRLNPKLIEKLARRHSDPKIRFPFTQMYFCSTPDSWRQQVSNYDVYVGDRLHGGIVCVQVGVPSIFLSDDKRVSEVAEHFDMPCYDIREVAHDASLVESFRSKEFLVAAYDKVANRYEQRLADFKSLLNSAGMSYREL